VNNAPIDPGVTTEAQKLALDTVSAFLDCSRKLDLDRAEGLLAPDMERIGPDGGVTSGRDVYLGYLRGLLGQVNDYDFELLRMTVTHDAASVVVEVHETLTEPDGTPVDVIEAMLFDLTPEMLIRRLSVYAKQ